MYNIPYLQVYTYILSLLHNQTNAVRSLGVLIQRAISDRHSTIGKTTPRRVF